MKDVLTSKAAYVAGILSLVAMIAFALPGEAVTSPAAQQGGVYQELGSDELGTYCVGDCGAIPCCFTAPIKR